MSRIWDTRLFKTVTIFDVFLWACSGTMASIWICGLGKCTPILVSSWKLMDKITLLVDPHPVLVLPDPPILIWNNFTALVLEAKKRGKIFNHKKSNVSQQPPKSKHRVDGVLSFFSSRRDSPTPSPASSFHCGKSYDKNNSHSKYGN
jgi:hypothetical protein